MIVQPLKKFLSDCFGRVADPSIRSRMRNQSRSKRSFAERLETRALLAVFTVSTAVDESDGDFSASDLSLREAIEQANSLAGADTILISQSLTSSTVTLGGTALVITDAVTINGSNAPGIRINGGGLSRVFDLQNRPDVSMSWLTISGGSTTAAGQGGGGIRSTGNLSLTGVVIENNTTSGDVSNGGGILQVNGALTLSNSSVRNNSTTGNGAYGGGISATGAVVSISNASRIESNTTASVSGVGGGILVSTGSLTIAGSTIAGNSNSGVGSVGGGIAVANAAVDISNSTISSNTTNGPGGGLAFDSNGNVQAVATLTRVTISGNQSANGFGGGAAAFNGAMTVGESTVTLNSAPTGQGSGLASYSDGGVNNAVIAVISSIVAGNSSTDVDSIGGGVFTSSGFNVIGNGNAADAFTVNGDQSSVSDPGLGQLANYGGPTLTHALLPGSPAIDAGATSIGSSSTDQRGSAYARLVGGVMDVGAFEVQPILQLVSSSSTISEDGGVNTITAQLSASSNLETSLGFAFSGTARLTADYTRSATQIVIPAGSLSGSISVTGVADNFAEADETITSLLNVYPVNLGFENGVRSVTTVIAANDGTPSLTLSLTPGTVAEGSVYSGTVIRNTDTLNSLTVTLSSNDSTELAVPVSVTIPAGQLGTTFSIRGVLDDIVDGSQTVTLTASAVGLGSGSGQVIVSDINTAGILVTAANPIRTNENGTGGLFYIRLNSIPSAPVIVTYASSDTTEGTTTTSNIVFTAANWNVSTGVFITAVDDSIDDGDITYSIITSAATSSDSNYNGMNPADVSVVNEDNDTATFVVSIVPGSIAEDGRTATGTVRRVTELLDEAVVVNLASSDTTEATVPSTVTIPAGAESATFTITSVDDSLVDGARTVTITASTTSGIAALDTAFGVNGRASLGTSYIQNADPSFPEVIVQPDGKIVVAGSDLTNSSRLNVIRLNANGTRDTTFGSNGLATTVFTGSSTGIVAQGIALDSSGQIYVVARGMGSQTHQVARFNSSGTLNLQINTSSALWGNDIVVDNSGGGRFIVGGGVGGDLAALRYNSNGTVDTTFGTSGVARLTLSATSEAGYKMQQQSDGRIIVAGSGPAGEFAAVRFNSNGSVDTSFSGDGLTTVDMGTSEFLQSVAIAADGRIVLAGSTDSRNDWAVARLLSNGDLDTSFSSDGKDLINFSGGGEEARSVVVQADGKIVVGGQVFLPTVNYQMGIVRYNVDGSFDATFGTNGRMYFAHPSSFEEVRALALEADGDIIALGGYYDAYDVFRIATVGAPYLPGSATLTVTDVEPPLVSFAFSSVAETSGTLNVTITRGSSDVDSAVTVNLTGSDNTELLVPATATIPAGSTQAIVTLSVLDDIFVDGPQVVTLTASIDGIGTSSANVTVTDNEVAGFSITDARVLNVEESGTSETIQVVLNAAPLTDVVLNVSSNDTTEAVSSPQTLTFTPANWNVAQTVTVTGVDDAVDDNNQTATILVSVNAGQSADAFDAVASRSVSVVVSDDDAAGFQFTPTTGLFVIEGVQSDSATLVLTSQPLANVTIGLTNGAPDQVTFSVSSMTFTPANWNVPQTVVLTSIDNHIAEISYGIGIGLQTAVSADPKYNGLSGTGVNGSIIDNEVRGVSYLPDLVRVSEAGTSADFTIVLTSEPTGPVTIPLSIDDATEASISVNQVQFTAANWNVPVTVTVTGVDDFLDDGSKVIYVVTDQIGGTSDYTGFNPADYVVINSDNDDPLITVTGTSSTFSEAGGSTSITVSRNSEDLSSALAVVVQSSDVSEATIPRSIVIPAGQASVDMTLSAVDDIFVDGPQTVTVTATAFGFASESATFTVTDNEVAGFTILDARVLEVDESGTSKTVQVVLNAAPLTNVVLSVDSADLSEVVASPATLTFTPANWNVAQTVTVTGVDDFVADGSQFASLSISVNTPQSNDAFDGVALQTVTALVSDDDQAGIRFTPNTGLLVIEGVQSDSVQVTLTSQPLADVTFGLTNAAPDQVTLSLSSLTFTPSNWNVPQTVVLTSIDNNIAEGGFGIGISPQAAVSADSKYNGLIAAGANGSIIDNDFRGVTVQPVSEHVSEAGTSTNFTIVLTSQPTGNVTVPLTVDDPTEGTLSVSQLLFSSANWNVPQAVTVTGVDDLLDDGDKFFYVLAGVIGGTSDYAGLDPVDIPVLNVDNDVAALTLSVSSATFSEAGGSITATVTRNSEDLSSALTVTLQSSDVSEAVVPASVIIPAGQASATFTITAVDDTLIDGTQAVQISVSASGFAGDTKIVSVTDNDPVNQSPVVQSVSNTTQTSTIIATQNASVSVVFVDANTSDTHSATIAWGDGTTSAGTVTTQANGTKTVSGTRAYSRAGIYVATVTIRDAAGATATASTALAITGAVKSGSTLLIVGTNSSDSISLALNGKNKIRVSAAFLGNKGIADFNLADFTGVEVWMSRGNDLLTIGSGVNLATAVVGGAGSDRITGGGANVLLLDSTIGEGRVTSSGLALSVPKLSASLLDQVFADLIDRDRDHWLWTL